MRIIYSNIKTERQCKSLKEATKLFGGDQETGNELVGKNHCYRAGRRDKRYHCNANVSIS